MVNRGKIRHRIENGPARDHATIAKEAFTRRPTTERPDQFTGCHLGARNDKEDEFGQTIRQPWERGFISHIVFATGRVAAISLGSLAFQEAK